jgi:hypothetical protein
MVIKTSPAEGGYGVDDESWLDEETSVDLEVDDELAFEEDDSPIRLVEDDNEDDRFAFGLHDAGSYAAEELAVHLI